MTKRICTVVLVLAVLIQLCSCGSSKFKVICVGPESIVSGAVYIRGTYGGQQIDMSLDGAFKDCEVVAVTFPDPDQVTISATEDSRVYFFGGIIAILKDGDGNTIEVPIKEESVFDAVKDGDRIYLIPPKA